MGVLLTEYHTMSWIQQGGPWVHNKWHAERAPVLKLPSMAALAPPGLPSSRKGREPTAPLGT
jgi:hypothetical protein